MARILVTGGCGFIGSHVVDALTNRGDDVRVLDNLSSGTRDYLPDSATFFEGDIADAALVAEAMNGCDGVVHLAAIASVPQCRDQWTNSHRTNVLGTVTILDAAANPCLQCRSSMHLPPRYMATTPICHCVKRKHRSPSPAMAWINGQTSVMPKWRTVPTG